MRSFNFKVNLVIFSCNLFVKFNIDFNHKLHSIYLCIKSNFTIYLVYILLYNPVINQILFETGKYSAVNILVLFDI